MDYYNIYHPFDGVINSEASTENHMFEYIGMVKANSLEDAFRNSQNDFNEDYEELNRRSTSIGDIISGPDNTTYMVMGTGFKRVPAVVLLNLGKIFNKIADEMLEDPEKYNLV